MSQKHEVTVSIVGSGGDGAVVAGDLIAMACAGRALHVIKTEAYGPQIRGGESSCTVRIGTVPLFAQAGANDALVVFKFADFARFRSEIALADDGLVFHEPDDVPPEELSGAPTSSSAPSDRAGEDVGAPHAGAPRRSVPVPFEKLARDANAPNAKNIVAIGLLAGLYALPADGLRSAIRQRFARRAPAVVEANLRALDAGLAFAAESHLDLPKLVGHDGPPLLLMSGNEASAFGAVHAGCRFFAGYPITPSSEILHYLSEWLPKIGGTCLQTEDELSAIGAVVGASFAGAKAMTATSGPGLSLMAEILGLSSIAEIPSVIVNVQRGGPSTGIPTRSEQSDLAHALYASHGDTPRVVLACCDVEDAFHTTVDAFNIAEEYQVPVIVLSDQMIGQRRETIEREALAHEVMERRVAVLGAGEDAGAPHVYERYAVTPDGVSPMAIPGTRGGEYQTNGLEHDERGRPASMFLVHERMNAKRYRKLDAIAERYKLFRRFGAPDPEVGILCWGSSSGPVREAIDRLTATGARVAAFVPRILEPLPAAELQAFIDSSEQILVIELSYSAQFHHYLRSRVDLPRGKTHVCSRSGGKALSVAEVVAAAQPLLRAVSLEEVLA